MSALVVAEPQIENAPVADRRAAGARSIGKVADFFTLAGFAFVPLFVPNIGGRFGLVASDGLLGLAVLSRALHVFAVGFPVKQLARHSYLLGVLGLFSIMLPIAQMVNGENPISWDAMRVAIATLGSVFLIATFGNGDWHKDRINLLRAFSLGCIVLALSSLTGPTIQGRPIGYALHPNSMGHSAVMGAFGAIWLMENVKNQTERLLWAFAGVCCLFAIMQSGSRGGLLGLFVGGVLYLALRGSRRAVLGAIACTWLAVMIVAFGIVKLPDSNPIARLFGDETTSGISNDARKDLLSEDLEFIGQSPVFGISFADGERIINVHVVYLQAWVAAGAVPAFCLMLLGLTMLVLPFLTARRDLALACGAAAVAVAWLFTNILNLRDQWLFLPLAFGSAQSINVLRRRD